MKARVALASVAFCAAALLAQNASQNPVDPPPEEQDRLLDRMHEYADHYIENLPNFLCEQTTRQFEAPVSSEKWRKGDTLVSKLSFHSGEEQRSLELVNGKPPSPGRKQRHSPLTTEGEFGLLMQSVLGKHSHAVFVWSHWETLRGKRLAVFDYTVDQLHSDLILSSAEGSPGEAKAIVGYRGSVFGDPETGAVWRISDIASEIPPRLQTREISTTVDYDEIAIGPARHLLPVEATVSLLLWTRKVKNELSFQGYRKFGADAVIHFGQEDIAPPGAPEKPNQ